MYHTTRQTTKTTQIATISTAATETLTAIAIEGGVEVLLVRAGFDSGEERDDSTGVGGIERKLEEECGGFGIKEESDADIVVLGAHL